MIYQTTVQVECIHSETDVELQERINQFCEQLAKCGDEVINVSYAIHSTSCRVAYDRRESREAALR